MQTFRKEERLTGFGLIRSLFKYGSVFYLSPFRITWMPAEPDITQPVRILLSVPKHHIRNAVDRNLIRRRMKEAYRLNKQILYVPLRENQQQILVCLTYNTREIQAYDQIRDKIIVILHRLLKENEKVTS